jgi:hypothetical protein
MMHRMRRWGVSPVATAEELAHMLSERTWTLCSGFFVAGHEDYLFVSDATSEDGAGEFAVYGAMNVMLSCFGSAWSRLQISAFFAT